MLEAAAWNCIRISRRSTLLFMTRNGRSDWGGCANGDVYAAACAEAQYPFLHLRREKQQRVQMTRMRCVVCRGLVDPETIASLCKAGVPCSRNMVPKPLYFN